MAASVSSKVYCCRPELSSPSSISSIAVTTITHLHLHNKIWRVNMEVERGQLKKKKSGGRDSSVEGHWCPHLNNMLVFAGQ